MEGRKGNALYQRLVEDVRHSFYSLLIRLLRPCKIGTSEGEEMEVCQETYRTVLARPLREENQVFR